ncbi:hypothetical protein BC826DRAFT_924025, partial [Russula brevipes]
KIFTSYFPLFYHHFHVALNKLHINDPTTNPSFRNLVYSATCINVGSQTCYNAHFDTCNYLDTLCAVTAFGYFNPNTGSHFILYNLKIFFHLPPGITVLLSSAGLKHENTAISSKETRGIKKHSAFCCFPDVTQFCPGGLMYWVTYGCKLVHLFSKKDRENMDKEAEKGWKKQLGHFSKLWKLDDDRKKVWNLKHNVRE